MVDFTGSTGTPAFTDAIKGTGRRAL